MVSSEKKRHKCDLALHRVRNQRRLAIATPLDLADYHVRYDRQDVSSGPRGSRVAPHGLFHETPQEISREFPQDPAAYHRVPRSSHGTPWERSGFPAGYRGCSSDVSLESRGFPCALIIPHKKSRGDPELCTKGQLVTARAWHGFLLCLFEVVHEGGDAGV